MPNFEGPRKRKPRHGPPVDTKWLLDQLTDHGLSIRQATAKLGYSSPSLLSKRIKGGAEGIKWRPEEARAFADLVRQPEAEVLRRVGLGPMRPLRGRITATADAGGKVRRLAEMRAVELPEDEIEAMEGVFIEAPGTALDRATVFYAPRATLAPDAVGKLSLVGLAQKNVLLGILDHGFGRGTWNVRGLTGALVAEGVKAEWAAPVAWARL